MVLWRSGLTAAASPPPSRLPPRPCARPARRRAGLERLTWQLVSSDPARHSGLDRRAAAGYEREPVRIDGPRGPVDRSARWTAAPEPSSARSALPRTLYGEGLALVGDHLIQLTWKDGEALVWDAATLTQTGPSSTRVRDGGCATTATRLVMSDGSSTLTFRDPATFAVTGSVDVTAQGQPVDQLNELECVDGSVWANVWETPWIVRIDATTGAVTGALDTTGLITPDPSVADPRRGPQRHRLRPGHGHLPADRASAGRACSRYASAAADARGSRVPPVGGRRRAATAPPAGGHQKVRVRVRT